MMAFIPLSFPWAGIRPQTLQSVGLEASEDTALSF